MCNELILEKDHSAYGVKANYLWSVTKIVAHSYFLSLVKSISVLYYYGKSMI